MIRTRSEIARLLALMGWYAILGWIIGFPAWGWEEPWAAFRWPLTATVTFLTWWPLSRWLRLEETARPPAGNDKKENGQ